MVFWIIYGIFAGILVVVWEPEMREKEPLKMDVFRVTKNYVGFFG